MRAWVEQGSERPRGAGKRGARLRVTALLAILSLAFVGGQVAPAAGQGVDETALRASLRTALTNFLRSQGAVEHISAVSLRVTFRGQRRAINVPVGTPATAAAGRSPPTVCGRSAATRR